MKVKETYSYRGWLNSDSFHKRMWSIFGYSVLAQIYLLIIFFAIALIIGFIFY